MARVDQKIASDDQGQSRPLSSATFRTISTTSNKVQNPQLPAHESNQDWRSIVSAVTTLFQKRSCSYISFDQLIEKARQVTKLDTGHVFIDYCQNHLFKKGMIILREEVKELTGSELLEKLITLWSQFFTEILPALEITFYPVEVHRTVAGIVRDSLLRITIETRGLTIRQAALISFRDILLLKTRIEETIYLRTARVSTPIIQMILVLLSVHDKTPATKEYVRLEKLAVEVIKPHYLPTSFVGNIPENIKPDNAYLRRLRGSILGIDGDITMGIPTIVRSESASVKLPVDDDIKDSLDSPTGYEEDPPRRHRVTVL